MASPPDELCELLGRIASSPETYRGVALHGLMAMASNVDDESIVSGEFATVHRLFDEIRSRRSAPPAPSSSPSSLWV